MSKRIALYVRVSTNDGRQDVRNQLDELRSWAERLGGTIVDEFIDTASGARSDRVELTRLLNEAHLRKFETVLVWSLDRLSREGIARMAGYIDRLKSCGVRLLSHQEPWLDTTGPVASLITAVFAWVGQFERQRISERIKMGLERARKTKKLGRPTASYDPIEIGRLRAAGASTRTIAKGLGISHVIVSTVLKNLPNTDPATS